MKKYYFMHPKTFKVCDIHNGRSLWEDHADKENWIVVREVGPAMDHWEEAMSIGITETLIQQIEEAMHAKGYSGELADFVTNKLRK